MPLPYRPPIQGVHYERRVIETDPQVFRNVVAQVDRAGLLDFLSRHPLASIEARRRLDDPDIPHGLQGANGLYDRDRRRVLLKVYRPHTYGDTFEAGRAASVSSCGVNLEDAIGRTLIHELGHHIESARPDLVPWFEEAFDRGHPITAVAGTFPNEYFCECLAVSVFHNAEFVGFDAVGYALIQAVYAALEVNQ